MAKSRAQIITDINNKFVTNGNIRAVDTNTTLKDILDCIELNDKGDLTGIGNRLTNVEQENLIQNNRLNVLEANMNTNDLSLFSKAFTAQGGSANGMFSFRGIQNHFVNITLRLRFLSGAEDVITFVDNNLIEVKSMLQGIIDFEANYMLNFLVTIVNNQGGTQILGDFRIANMNLHFQDEQTLVIRLQNYQNIPSTLQLGDEIYTSIAIHSVYSDPTGKITEGIHKELKNPAEVFVNDPKKTINPKDKLTNSFVDTQVGVTPSKLRVANTTPKQVTKKTTPKVEKKSNQTAKKTEKATTKKPTTVAKKTTPITPKKTAVNRKNKK